MILCDLHTSVARAVRMAANWRGGCGIRTAHSKGTWQALRGMLELVKEVGYVLRRASEQVQGTLLPRV